MNDNLASYVASICAQSRARIAPASEYYAMTLLSPEEGKIQWSLTTHWVGWVNDKPPHEIRQGSIVRADRLADVWQDLGQSFLVANTPGDLGYYLRAGGHALVERGLALKHLADFVGPKPTVRDGPLGFKNLEGVPQSAFNRAPTPKLRMRILKRDDMRCRICGRRPADNVDIELHTHHIRPWGTGGLTEDDNLITICHTCHKGLEPHEDHRLFDLIDAKGRWSLGKAPLAYYQSVVRYRQYTARLIAEVYRTRPGKPRGPRAV